MKIRATTALLSLAILAGRVPAAPTTQPAAPSATPTTQPSAEISALIRQLGADDFHDRRDASQKLKQLGKAAIPALKEARNSKDPEIQARADELLQEIDEPTVTEEPIPQPAGAAGAHAMSMSFNNGAKVTDIQENGRTIHIEQNGAGIKMVVTGQIDGKQVTREYKALNAEKFQKHSPKAFALYLQYGGGGAMGVGRIQFQGANGIGVNNINIRVNGVAGGPNVAPAPAPGKLGITAGESKDGVEALGVIPGSRAEKIGVKQNDVIQKINGKEVKTVAELMKVMAENPKDLVVEALRDGKPVTLTEVKKLEEKKADAVEVKAESKKE
jgi:hypothetical protein